MLLNYAVSLAIAKDTLWRYANIVVLLFCKSFYFYYTLYFSTLFNPKFRNWQNCHFSTSVILHSAVSILFRKFSQFNHILFSTICRLVPVFFTKNYS